MGEIFSIYEVLVVGDEVKVRAGEVVVRNVLARIIKKTEG